MERLINDKTILEKKECTIEKIDDCMIVISNESEDVSPIYLSEVAAEIFSEIDGEKDVAMLIEEMLKKYDVKYEDLRSDIFDVINEFINNGLVNLLT